MKVVYEDEYGTGVFYFDTFIDRSEETGTFTFINCEIAKCINLDYRQILEVKKESYHRKNNFLR